MKTRPEPVAHTHTWVGEDTARALGLDPDVLPARLHSINWPNSDAIDVQVPNALLDRHFKR